MKKVIHYYTREIYGNKHEYVLNAGDAKIIAQLTGKKTINGIVRELIRDLTCGTIQFEQVIAP